MPRRLDGTAIIGDPRNEENLITSQMHLLFLKFYNKIFDEVKLKNQQMLLPQLITESKKIFLWHFSKEKNISLPIRSTRKIHHMSRSYS